MGRADADEEQTWRCKACGKRQRDPDPPCERCWNTTFVAGDGASDAAGGAQSLASPSASPHEGLTPARAERVKMAVNRATAATVALAVLLAGAYEVLPASNPLSTAAFTSAVSFGVLAVLFLLGSVLVTVTDSVDGLVTE
ncbi:hypothetical protein [Halobacterium wangiae]|uniref:hypothetical protein n=1 Tax=Halobacterium wangiae TaxID=2902623 RepID=UPI001E5A61DE|nr:hypothetical protein [Halobacterium wangiae]